jgi:hypothetical protein
MVEKFPLRTAPEVIPYNSDWDFYNRASAEYKFMGFNKLLSHYHVEPDTWRSWAPGGFGILDE